MGRTSKAGPRCVSAAAPAAAPVTPGPGSSGCSQQGPHTAPGRLAWLVRAPRSLSPTPHETLSWSLVSHTEIGKVTFPRRGRAAGPGRRGAGSRAGARASRGPRQARPGSWRLRDSAPSPGATGRMLPGSLQGQTSEQRQKPRGREWLRRHASPRSGCGRAGLGTPPRAPPRARRARTPYARAPGSDACPRGQRQAHELPVCSPSNQHLSGRG